MKVCMESTEKIVALNGVPARIWEGHTESGIPVIVYVTRVQVPEDADQEQFQRELEEHRPPSPEAVAIPLRLIL